jgi:ribonuclease HI
LKEVRDSIKYLRNKLVSDEEIWRSLRNKDFLPRTAQFLWRRMHNAHRIGKYWKHIPDCEERALCQECGELEDLEHILIHCRSSGPEIIWKAAEKLWCNKEPEWPEISLGGVLGCGLVNFKDERGKTKCGAQRLYRILISESVYTLWTIRNERVISRAGAPLTEAEIINKWIFNLNQCLQQDVLLANRSARRNRPHLVPTLVRETWSSTLDDENKLPENWVRESRVLVGRRTLTHNQLRNRNNGVG